MKYGTVALWMIVLLGFPQSSASDQYQSPFQDCHRQAFLVEGSPSRMWSVDLVTGMYFHVATYGSQINAIGFSVHDRFIYGFDNDSQTLARIGAEFQVFEAPIVGLPSVNLLAGDVHPFSNKYYVYRHFYGLYEISLSETDRLPGGEYQAIQVIPPPAAISRISDFAFSPLDGYLYGVDSSGELIGMNPVSGSQVALGNLGIEGIFGAAYFDHLGYLYLQHNFTGSIYRVDLSGGLAPVAELYSSGPTSILNDGARCSFASVIAEEVCDNGLDDDFDGLVDLDDDDCSGVNPPAVPMLPPLGFAALIVLLVAARRRIER